MKPGSVAVVGAAESTEMGRVPNRSVIGIHADAALNAFADAGIAAKDIDGIATAGMRPTDLAHYLGIVPTWVDGTAVGGCSFMLHVGHAAAAINDGLCTTVLITHGESGRSRVGADGFGASPASLAGQFEAPYGPMGPTTLFTIPWLRYAKTYSVGHEALAEVAVVQREWASRNPRATLQDLTTVDEVMNDRVIAWPFTKAMCCLVTDGGGALIITASDRVADFDSTPVFVLGTGESVETPMVSQMEDFTSSRAFRVSGPRALAEAGIGHADVDHLMIYDAFAHLPIYGLEDLGFVGQGEGPAFITEGNTRAGGQLPLNTNGGGLSYMHSGMYGMYALQESVRQVRGVAAAQVEHVEISVAHGVGGMFGAAGTIVFGRNRPS
ncbi:MAG: thiolase [Actinomycetia bacterium]|nr:thiolase [Actinomycetes bacterium]MCP4083516.1 thiolase [Actinomycetes bacterium]